MYPDKLGKGWRLNDNISMNRFLSITLGKQGENVRFSNPSYYLYLKDRDSCHFKTNAYLLSFLPVP